MQHHGTLAPSRPGTGQVRENVRRRLATALLVVGSLLGALLVSALIFAVDQALPATLIP